MLNGPIKALLEAPVMNRSALSAPYHDKVGRVSPVTSQAIPLTLRDLWGPRGGAHRGGSYTGGRGHALASSSSEPGRLHRHVVGRAHQARALVRGRCDREGCEMGLARSPARSCAGSPP